MPTDSKRLQVIDRLVIVLKKITAGADYFFTARQVGKGFIAAPVAFPVYMVRSESGGEIDMHSDFNFRETFTVGVSGKVQDQADVVTPVERSIRDVRKAIEEDLKPAAGAGSLGTLVTSLEFDTPPDILYDVDGSGPFAEFTQRVRITVDGEWGEI